MATVTIRDLSYAYGTVPVLQSITASFAPGLTAVVGPNASGKSTLIKCLSGLYRPRTGTVEIDGQALHHLPLHRRNTTISYLPQDTSGTVHLTVLEVVLIGMCDDLVWRVAEDQMQRVDRVLQCLSIDALAPRYFDELSGGQRQMVLIAQALVRGPSVLLLDEPTNSLDIRHQFELLDTIAELTRSGSLTTVMALHDLNLAARYADQIVSLHEGSMRSSGPPSTVLTPEFIRSIYGVEAYVGECAAGRLMVTPLERSTARGIGFTPGGPMRGRPSPHSQVGGS